MTGEGGDTLLERAIGAHERRDLAEAEKLYRATFAADQGCAAALLGLGMLLREAGRLEEARACLEVCLPLAADPTDALRELALVLLDAGDPAGALRAAERAAPGLDPESRAGLLGLASLCSRDYTRAERELKRALAVAPDALDLAASVGVALEGQGRFADAIAHYRACLARRPGHHPAQYQLAQLLLGQGGFAEGWSQYFTRIAPGERQSSRVPFVEARELSGKRVLILTEQGIGDEIFFLRYVSMLREIARPDAIAYAASPKLQGLLGRMPGLDGVCTPGEAQAWNGPRILLGDLPGVCRPANGHALPAPLRIPALPDRVERWRGVLREFGPAPYLAVNWRSGQGSHGRGPRRWLGQLQVKQIDPALVGRALRGWPGTAISVQRLQDPGDLQKFRDGFGGRVLDASSANDDIEDLLALLSAVDELVGVSSASVHLRAAAGKASRVLVPHPPEWRWMTAGERSPWYPSCNTYRQPLDLFWSQAFVNLRRDLGLPESVR